MKLAEKGIEELQQYVDTLLTIPNQNLFRIANEKTTFSDAFKMASTSACGACSALQGATRLRRACATRFTASRWASCCLPACWPRGCMRQPSNARRTPAPARFSAGPSAAARQRRRMPHAPAPSASPARSRYGSRCLRHALVAATRWRSRSPCRAPAAAGSASTADSVRHPTARWPPLVPACRSRHPCPWLAQQDPSHCATPMTFCRA